MPRRGNVPTREILPDPLYNSELVTRFINKIMLSGKKALAETIFYGALEDVQAKTGRNALEVLEEAVKNAMPLLEVRARRVGGATYQVPVEVRPERRTALALRWIVNAARDRSERTMRERLAAEILDAASGAGAAVKKREDTHRMAEANRAFAHYRW
ncbi:MAG: 30S ribosomal protein S7 [Firmicutes bacterium]|jgi:small subunit ribosomal protein S7|nr:30S ribosomal protein S7 [Bacillota bacterium]HQD38930.1 30S ribosomal protein S7 [Bacillota bacterium]